MNPFGVPASLPAARLRLPEGDATLSLSATSSGRPSIPTPDQLVDVEWVSADCVLWTWPSGALADLSAALRVTEVKLAFVEPTAGLGLRHRLQVAAGPWLARRTGHRHHRDIPHELRQVGFVVTTTVRFVDGIGHYVWGEARHYRHRITIR